jgi:cellobiose-specific phosphotransferase system component IIA
MDPVTIIGAGIAIINLVTKAIGAANNGDMTAAQDYMKQASDHVSKAIAGWNAAPGPTT